MWEQWILSQRQYRQGDCEENREDLEGNQLWEGFIDITLVAELNAEELDRDPKNDAT